MGARESRASILSYDEAAKRVTATELHRIQEAYKRACGFVSIMRETTFIKDVLGDSVPQKLAQRIFSVMSSHGKGMTFRDLLVTLVLLTRGRHEERLKLIYAVYCDEQGSSVTSRSMSNMILACENTALPHEALPLFKMADHVSYDQFRSWVLDYPNITSVTRWLVNSSGITVSLTDDMEMPNFYQTLAGVTHLVESDIIELEKCYWQLKSQSKVGRFDLATFQSFVCPPLPVALVKGLFNAFDENKDGHIDFKEISCGVSACCRGPLTERQKFCFKIFDMDQDNKLDENELKQMAFGLLEVEKANRIRGKRLQENDLENNNSVDAILSHILQFSNNQERYITLEEYQLWSLRDALPTVLLNMIIEISHIVLGLRPSSHQEEGTIIRGWMHRAKNEDYCVGETWYVVSSKWWNAWKKYTEYDPILSPSLSEGWEHMGEEKETRSISQSSSADNVGFAVEATEVMPHTLPADKSGKLRNKLQSKRTTKPPFSISSSSFPLPGPINNSDILVEESSKVGTLTDEGGKLKDHLVKGIDFEVLPKQVWKALFYWYGGSPTLPRIVPCPVEGEKPWLELYRMHILILQHQLPSTMQQLSQISFPGSGPLAGVGNTTLGMIKQSLTYVAGGNNPKRHVTHRSTFSKRHTVGQVSLFLSQRLRIPLENMRLWHLIDENNADLLEDESTKLESIGINSSNARILIEVRNMDMSWPEELSQIARNHKQKLKQAENGTKQVTLGGTTGLSNLGNTCFMNSGLQCISNTQPLTKYFLENKHLYELNRTNPLGMKGHIAKRYSDLTHDLWSGTSKSLAPLKVRWTISKYAPRFNGYSQHDSQELLAFLLDGLHEDLNRVQEKPYVELKDSDGRPDEEVAQEAWENHLSRNQSIIVDLFHGQIKSKVRCMQCNAISVRFDPFTFLSLPLPMDNLMYFDVIMTRLDGETPIRYGLRLSMDGTFQAVRKQLAQKCKLDVDTILLGEVVGATIKVRLSDSLKVRTSALGNLYAYEIPPPTKRNISLLHDDVNIPFDSKMLNGDLHHISSRNRTDVNEGFEKEKLENAMSHQPNIGSSVHETSKRSITNLSALHINPLVNGADNYENVTGTDFKSPSVKTADANCDSRNTEVHSNPDISKQQSGSSFSTFYVNNSKGNDIGYSVNGVSSVQRSLESGDNSVTSTSLQHSKTPGYVIAFHRKIFHLDVYFLSSQKHRPNLFGLPIVVPCMAGQPRRLLYNAVWKLVSRFVSPLPPAESTVVNHAQDCDDSLGTQFPFVLRCVRQCGMLCGNSCPWFRFCKGCLIPCDDEAWQQTSEYIAIDWDPTALHLRYQPSVEREVTDDISVEEGHRGQQQRIDLDHCLRAFTSEEDLGKDELYQCGKCKKPQLAKKKLDIWRLPPVLIIHLKRFHYVNGRWIKSHKVVDFPKTDFDPSHFMSQRDSNDSAPTTNEESALLHNDENCNASVETSNNHDATTKTNHEEKSACKPRISFDGDVISGAESTPKPCANMKEPGVHAEDLHNVKEKLQQNSAGPARRRQPSFRENSPLYDLYAMSCHSGILGGGHYIAYARNQHNNKWYCYNDSSCKEVSAETISVETAYTLFYQRKGLDYEDFMPPTAGKIPIDTDSMDEDYNSEFKKYCIVQ